MDGVRQQKPQRKEYRKLQETHAQDRHRLRTDTLPLLLHSCMFVHEGTG